MFDVLNFCTLNGQLFIENLLSGNVHYTYNLAFFLCRRAPSLGAVEALLVDCGIALTRLAVHYPHVIREASGCHRRSAHLALFLHPLVDLLDVLLQVALIPE